MQNIREYWKNEEVGICVFALPLSKPFTKHGQRSQ
jgi:hypothetical protein